MPMRSLLRTPSVLIAAMLAWETTAGAATGTGSAHMEQLRELWAPYLARFVDAGGRVVDHVNGDISHSEGQGYVMLLSERIGDRETFTRVWQWTDRNLYTHDPNLASWRWDPKATPHVTDANNASDGDLLIAWALTEAADKWNVPAYAARARQIAGAIAAKLVTPSRFGPVLMPARKGFGAGEQPDGPVVNLSYWIFPALDAMRRLTGDGAWDGIAATGERLIAAARFGPRKLPSNWVSLAGDTPAPARSFPAVFGYDAVRIPLYAAWGGRRQLAAAFAPLELAVIDVNSGEAREPLSDPDYKPIAALAGCLARQSGAAALSALGYHGQSYFPATLHLLSLGAADTAGCAT